MTYDLAVVGAGILGLAHALAAVRRGLKVVVLDRDMAAAGASVRNFGLVVVSGQEPGEARRRAERSARSGRGRRVCGNREAPSVNAIVAQRPEALARSNAYASLFGASENADDARNVRAPAGLDMAIAGLLVARNRVESRDATPGLPHSGGLPSGGVSRGVRSCRGAAGRDQAVR